MILIVFTHLQAAGQQNYIQYVNPMIGTQRMGHTYPGATVPFGSVQLSPDTDEQPHNIGGKYNPDTYKYCAGYQYDDKTIVGFSHTHFSGTGHSDLGDFLIMPTVGDLQLTPGDKDNPKSGFRSAFSHATEVAEADYYKVLLEDDNILAEMTATTVSNVRPALQEYAAGTCGTGDRGIVDEARCSVFVNDIETALQTNEVSPRLTSLASEPHQRFRAVASAKHRLFT